MVSRSAFASMSFFLGTKSPVGHRPGGDVLQPGVDAARHLAAAGAVLGSQNAKHLAFQLKDHGDLSSDATIMGESPIPRPDGWQASAW